VCAPMSTNLGRRKYIKSVYAVCWILFSNSLILVNHKLMVQVGFCFPATLCSLGVCTTWLSAVCAHFARISKTKRPVAMSDFTRVWPVGAALACTLVLGNWLYLHMSVSFIQIIKATSPLITHCMLMLSGIEVGNQRLRCGLLLIASGSLVSFGPEFYHGTPAVVAIVVALLCEVSEGIRMVLLQTTLQGQELDLWQSVLIVSPSSLFFLALCIYFFELDALRERDGLSTACQNSLLLTCASCLGVLVNICALGVVRHAGGVSLKVLGQAKNFALICFSVATLHETISMTQLIGYFLSLSGFHIYRSSKI